MTIKTGSVLPNGATALATAENQGNFRSTFVLAEFRGEYVTWATDHEGNCYWGHYFQDDLLAAAKDLEERAR